MTGTVVQSYTVVRFLYGCMAATEHTNIASHYKYTLYRALYRLQTEQNVRHFEFDFGICDRLCLRLRLRLRIQRIAIVQHRFEYHSIIMENRMASIWDGS